MKQKIEPYFGYVDGIGSTLEDGRIVIGIRHADIYRNCKTLQRICKLGKGAVAQQN